MAPHPPYISAPSGHAPHPPPKAGTREVPVRARISIRNKPKQAPPPAACACAGRILQLAPFNGNLMDWQDWHPLGPATLRYFVLDSKSTCAGVQLQNSMRGDGAHTQQCNNYEAWTPSYTLSHGPIYEVGQEMSVAVSTPWLPSLKASPPPVTT